MSKKITRSNISDSDIKKFLLFLEEFGWLLSAYSNLDLRAASKEISTRLVHSSDMSDAVGSYVSANPNKHFLVGVLPRLLIDETLFPTNEDISEFAKVVMKVHIPRSHKKSKYELIGHIVCQTEMLNDKGLSNLVQALSKLTDGDETTKNLVKQRKAQNFGWNLIIQELAKGR